MLLGLGEFEAASRGAHQDLHYGCLCRGDLDVLFDDSLEIPFASAERVQIYTGTTGQLENNQGNKGVYVVPSRAAANFPSPLRAMLRLYHALALDLSSSMTDVASAAAWAHLVENHFIWREETTEIVDALFQLQVREAPVEWVCPLRRSYGHSLAVAFDGSLIILRGK